MTTRTPRDAWDWPERERRRVAAQPILRPRDMLAQHGLRPDRRCGDCTAFIPARKGQSPRCGRSLQGNPERAGIPWYADWRACGAFTVAREPAPAAPTPTVYEQQQELL